MCVKSLPCCGGFASLRSVIGCEIAPLSQPVGYKDKSNFSITHVFHIKFFEMAFQKKISFMNTVSSFYGA